MLIPAFTPGLADEWDGNGVGDADADGEVVCDSVTVSVPGGDENAELLDVEVGCGTGLPGVATTENAPSE
jgi:hypothetical protein